MQTILLVGTGNMGRSMLDGWLQSIGDDFHFIVVDPYAEDALKALQAQSGAKFEHYANASLLPKECAPVAVVLAVKPDMLIGLLDEIKSVLLPETLLISVAAGKSIAYIQEGAGGDQPVARVMPNIGALVGQSVSAGICSENAPDDAKRIVEIMFDAIGQFSWLDAEDDIHAVTAISGSGPAYFFAICEAIIGAAIENGLSPQVAEELVLGTCQSAGALLKQTPDAAKLRQQVTSPNGTTAAGLAALGTSNRLKTVMTDAVNAAKQRSIEMSQDQ